jgi:hypothetical protein
MEICIIDREALDKSLRLLQLRCVATTGSIWLIQERHMEALANQMFKRWTWKVITPHGLFPLGIVDIDTGDCLILR